MPVARGKASIIFAACPEDWICGRIAILVIAPRDYVLAFDTHFLNVILSASTAVGKDEL